MVQKSSMNIFRFEDVIFSVYPHMAAHRRRGTSLKEAFASIDPNAKKIGANIGGQNPDLGMIKTGGATADSFGNMLNLGGGVASKRTMD